MRTHGNVSPGTPKPRSGDIHPIAARRTARNQFHACRLSRPIHTLCMAPVPKASDRKSRLQEFVDWAAAHISGDEKRRSSRPFWERVRVRAFDRLLQTFGQKGLLEVGGKAEFRIRKAKEDGGGTAFADYVWKPHGRSVEATEAAHCGVGKSGRFVIGHEHSHQLDPLFVAATCSRRRLPLQLHRAGGRCTRRARHTLQRERLTAAEQYYRRWRLRG